MQSTLQMLDLIVLNFSLGVKAEDRILYVWRNVVGEKRAEGSKYVSSYDLRIDFAFQLKGRQVAKGAAPKPYASS